MELLYFFGYGVVIGLSVYAYIMIYDNIDENEINI